MEDRRLLISAADTVALREKLFCSRLLLLSTSDESDVDNIDPRFCGTSNNDFVSIDPRVVESIDPRLAVVVEECREEESRNDEDFINDSLRDDPVKEAPMGLDITA